MSFILFIAVFLFIYNPPIVGLPVNSGVLVGGLCFLFYILKYTFKTKVFLKKISENKLWLIIISLIFIILYSLLIGILSGSFDIQLSKNYTSFLIIYLPGAIFFGKYFSKIYTLEKTLLFIENIVFFQSIIITIMFISPGFRDFIFNLLKDGSIRQLKNELSGGFRFLGFSYGTTWDLAFLQSLSLVFFSIRIRLFSSKTKFRDVIKFFLILLTGIISGRTVFIGLLISIIILVLPVSFKNISVKKSLILFAKMSFVALISFIFIRLIVPEDVKKTIDDNVIPWAFEMFEEKSNGNYETASSNELKKMYFEIPIQTLFFGDGFYVNPNDKDKYYMDTDAGYMRHVLYYGIFGTFAVIIFYILIFKRMIQSFKNFKYYFFIKTCVFLIMFYFFIGHIKGDLLSGADMPIKFLFLMCMIFIFYNKIGVKNGNC